MFLIIEGPDGSGKTTLAHKVESQFGVPYTRYEGLSSTQGPDAGIVQWWLDRIHAVESPHGVFDRCFFISEIIYQLVMPKRPLMVSGETMLGGLQDLWGTEPHMIFCLPQWEVSREIIRAQPNKLEGVGLPELEKVHWAYWSFYAMWTNVFGPDNVTMYDFRRHNESLLFHWIKERL